MANIIKSKPYRYVLIHHNVCKFLEYQVIVCGDRPESGGILIGRYRGPHLEITEWTEPGAADLSSLTAFVKRDPRHQAAATAAWQNSSETKTYAGEWHTHPSGAVSPSGIDRGTWKEITRKNRRRSVFVLVSPGGWGIFLVTAGSPQDLIHLAKIEDGTVGVVFTAD